jgi:hypothetical protein
MSKIKECPHLGILKSIGFPNTDKLGDLRDGLQILSDASYREGVMNGKVFVIIIYAALILS